MALGMTVWGIAAVLPPQAQFLGVIAGGTLVAAGITLITTSV